MRRSSTLLYSLLGFGYAFLYLPIIVLMVYSFNNARLATVWAASRLAGTAPCSTIPRFSTPPC